jgi:hypothetical protein
MAEKLDMLLFDITSSKKCNCISIITEGMAKFSLKRPCMEFIWIHMGSS